MFHKNFQLLGVFLLLMSCSFAEKAVTSDYQAQVVGQFDDVIWGFDFFSEKEVVLTLKNGQIYYLNILSNQKKLLTTIKVNDEGQGGLLDILKVAKESKVYFYYTFSKTLKEATATSLGRFLYDSQQISNNEELFVTSVISDTSRHFGSRLAQVGDSLYMTVGDRGEREQAQNIKNHNGSILRLTLEGKAYPDNPFSEGAKEIYSIGHRNPQGIAYNPNTKSLYALEFGPRGGDELNLIEAGKNYGWPVITYGKEYYGPKIGTTHQKGMEQPVVYWVPSISASGMSFYWGEKIPEWKGSLFLGCLGSEHLRRLVIKDGKVIEQEKLFEKLSQRVRQVRTSPDGFLYFSTDSGKLIKVSKGNSNVR